MAAYSAEHWTDLFVAAAGASAALTGLVFVAVSINIERILRLAGVPERAFQTIVLLGRPGPRLDPPPDVPSLCSL